MTAQPRDPFDEDIEAVLASDLWARRSTVMFMRNSGATWAEVCREVQVSETTARKDYDLFCGHINSEDPTKTTARHRAVIFDVQRAMYRWLFSHDYEAAVAAGKVILRTLEREAKLLGLDSPTRILANVSSEDFANEAARLITSIQQLDPDTLKELGRAQGHDPFVIDADPRDEIIAEIVEPEPAKPAKRAGRRAQRAVSAPRPAVAADGDSAAKPAGRSRRSRGQKNLGRADGHGGPGDNAGDHSTHTDPRQHPTGNRPAVDRLPDDDDDWSNL